MRNLTAATLAAIVALAATGGAACKRRANDWPPGMRATPPESATTLVHDAKGDVVLLVLYASWCSGCRAELPAIDKLALSYEGRGLRVVALALDEDPQDFSEMLAEQKVHLELVRVAPMDDERLRRAVGALGGRYAGSIPYAALFDRSGKLTKEWIGNETANDMEQTIVPLL